jgi:hypothetical protein
MSGTDRLAVRGGPAFGLGLAGVVLAALAGGGAVRAADPPAPTPAPARKLDFNREIRPILSDGCFACHGFDDKTRKAGLRLDTPEGARAALAAGGGHAIVPGVPDESDVIFRVETDDDSLRMPPKDSGKSLTPEQVATLRRWVAEGAGYAAHWAFVPPTRPEVPKVGRPEWVRTPIDAFILSRLEQAGLTPADEADRPTLIRRLTLDLTGLPPTPKEVDDFLADKSPNAYETLVNRLLDSPRLGEHLGRSWLDAARYGDTHGLHLDNYREIWPYRDWVIRAFNANKPFDQFLVEQLAGDLLPNPTPDQLVATGYNRCHVSTSEGGSIEEEVYVRNVVDQVDTNGTVLLGLTMGCARCHDHKYDPIRMKDYYSLFAFFNNIDGSPLDGNNAKWAPVIPVPSPEQASRRDELDATLAGLRKSLAAEVAKVPYDDAADRGLGEFVQRGDFVWIDDAPPPGATVSNEGASDPKAWPVVTGPDHPVLSGSGAQFKVAEGQAQHFVQDAKPALKVGPGDVLFTYVFLDPLRPPREVMLQWNTGQWSHRAYWGENLIDYGKDNSPERLRVGDLPTTGKWVRLEVPAAKVGLKPGAAVTGWAFTQHGGAVAWDKSGIETYTPQEGQLYDTLTEWVRGQKAVDGAGLPENLKAIVKLERSKRNPEQARALRDHFLATAYRKGREVLGPLHAQVADVEKRRKDLDATIPTTLVMKERAEPRPAFLLNRGEYDQRKDPVGRATPSFLPPLPEGAPVNRLGFARWLVDPGHPLTARVAANRFWQHFMGTGIVKTAEDFGSQGEPPTHPELLDWLAVQFREDGWDTKLFLKRIVMSAAYRQEAKVTPEKLHQDPENRLLSRGPRFRLDAEILRDQALFVSGLLIERLGGPSVKPPQPAGLWEAVGFVGSDTANFTADTGQEKVHRRSMYTFWKRTSAPPQMTTLDAPSRESCTVRRERTNTPLQALLLMNEPQFVEASRALAQRGLREGGATDEARLTYLFRVVNTRPPRPAELAELTAALADLRAHYRANVDAAKGLIAVGETKPDPTLDPAELAAWTILGNTLLNLDEVVTKG